jgi:hypothetical protein
MPAADIQLLANMMSACNISAVAKSFHPDLKDTIRPRTNQENWTVDSVSGQWLIRFLKHRIADRRIDPPDSELASAGVREDGVLTVRLISRARPHCVIGGKAEQIADG